MVLGWSSSGPQAILEHMPRITEMVLEMVLGQSSIWSQAIFEQIPQETGISINLQLRFKPTRDVEGLVVESVDVINIASEKHDL